MEDRAKVKYTTAWIDNKFKRVVIILDEDYEKLLSHISNLEAQLGEVDNVLSRRDALDSIPDRIAKILHTIETAKRAEKAEAANEELRKAQCVNVQEVEDMEKECAESRAETDFFRHELNEKTRLLGNATAELQEKENEELRREIEGLKKELIYYENESKSKVVK
jgi:hypothetical protein